MLIDRKEWTWSTLRQGKWGSVHHDTIDVKTEMHTRLLQIEHAIEMATSGASLVVDPCSIEMQNGITSGIGPNVEPRHRTISPSLVAYAMRHSTAYGILNNSAILFAPTMA
jgi:hypothetical protein